MKLEKKTGIQLISEERQRQVEKEGWTPEHDDQHFCDELATAGAVYALPERQRESQWPKSTPKLWPWDSEWYKPTPDDRIKELAKAGALIAAEIDRLNSLDR